MHSMFNMNNKDFKDATMTFKGNSATQFYTTSNGDKIKEFYMLVEE